MPQGLVSAKPGLKDAITAAFMKATRDGSATDADPDSIAIALGEEIGEAVNTFVRSANVIADLSGTQIATAQGPAPQPPGTLTRAGDGNLR